VYERSILILDSPNCALGDFALGLIAMGLHPHHALDLDDLVRLANERREFAGALAAPASLFAEQLERIRKELLEPLGLPLACAIPVGPRPSDAEIEQLLLAGVRWAAFEPASPRDLRYVFALALSFADGTESRAEPRVPIELNVEVSTGERVFRASLRDVSPNGAYIAARSPLRAGTKLVLKFTLDGAAIEAPCEVRWRTSLDGGFAGWLDAGMGVQFVDLAAETSAALAAFAAKSEQRFTLAAARSGA
jgi:uncharacterized protein (TIGR02266 family)